jgi:hypothetical protein
MQLNLESQTEFYISSLLHSFTLILKNKQRVQMTKAGKNELGKER